MVKIVWESDGLVRVLSGTVTTAEMDSSGQEIQSHPRIDEMRYHIHDFTIATDIQMTDDEMEFLATRAAVSVRKNPRIRIAFVGSHPVLQRLMGIFNQSGCSPHRIRHCHTLDEARAYAGSTAMTA